eukprot:4513072-Pleurochrysis_carterae.AAC.1
MGYTAGGAPALPHPLPLSLLFSSLPPPLPPWPSLPPSLYSSLARSHTLRVVASPHRTTRSWKGQIVSNAIEGCERCRHSTTNWCDPGKAARKGLT